MMIRTRERKRPLSEINVVPYIDVMLVLLVIFMITTPLMSQGVNVDLPQASAHPLASKNKKSLVVSIDSQGRYFLNAAKNPQEPIEAEAMLQQVAQELQEVKQQNGQYEVLVKGDKHVDYGKVVQAMALLQQAGAESVGLMTEGLTRE